jgi:uncharacterized protein YgiB involved in biofilm formation
VREGDRIEPTDWLRLLRRVTESNQLTLAAFAAQGVFVGRDGQTSDGCGTFWKRAVFEQV